MAFLENESRGGSFDEKPLKGGGVIRVKIILIRSNFLKILIKCSEMTFLKKLKYSHFIRFLQTLEDQKILELGGNYSIIP